LIDKTFEINDEKRKMKPNKLSNVSLKFSNCQKNYYSKTINIGNIKNVNKLQFKIYYKNERVIHIDEIFAHKYEKGKN
jgi:hypothetical protein